MAFLDLEEGIAELFSDYVAEPVLVTRRRREHQGGTRRTKTDYWSVQLREAARRERYQELLARETERPLVVTVTKPHVVCCRFCRYQAPTRAALYGHWHRWHSNPR